MVRRRWPDIVVVAGVVTVLLTGVWALWGEDLRQWWKPTQKQTEDVKHGGGVT